MIKASELRLGNFLIWNPKLLNPQATLPSMFIEVASITADEIGYTPPNFEHRVEPFEDDLLQKEKHIKSPEELEPIPLSAELLGKCCFQKITDYQGDEIVKISTAEFNIKYDEVDGVVIERFLTSWRAKTYKYLHQLQNMYFDLTGEELEVNF